MLTTLPSLLPVDCFHDSNFDNNGNIFDSFSRKPQCLLQQSSYQLCKVEQYTSFQKSNKDKEKALEHLSIR